MPKLRRFSAWWLGPILLSGALRMFQLQRSSYWLDEMVSLSRAGHPGFRALFADNNPPLYHFLLKFWMMLVGNGAFATRSLSVIFSVVATAFVMKAAAEIRNRRSTILLAGFVHGICILSMAYAREARMYSLFEMWMAISLYYFMSLYRHRAGAAIGFAFSCVGMALTHYLAVVPISIELAFLLLSPRVLERTQKVALFLVVLAATGVQAWIYSRFFKWDGLQWQIMKSAAEPLSFWPRDLLLRLADGSLLSGGVLLLVWGSGMIQIFATREEERLQRIALVSLVLIPICAFSVATLLSGRAMLLPRYLVFVAPPACLFVSLVEIGRREISSVLAGLFVVGSLSGLHRFYGHRREPWRAAAAMVQRYPDSVVFTTRTLALSTPYFDRIGVPVRRLDLSGANQGVTELAADVAKGKTVWVVENFWGGYSYMPELKQTLKALHFKVAEASLRDGSSPPVLLMMIQGEH